MKRGKLPRLNENSYSREGLVRNLVFLSFWPELLRSGWREEEARAEEGRRKLPPFTDNSAQEGGAFPSSTQTPTLERVWSETFFFSLFEQ